MKRSFTLRDAAILAVLLHAALFLLDYLFEGRIAGVFTQVPKTAEQSEPLPFRFVDVPEDKKEKPEPTKSQELSDRERASRTPERAPKPSEQPRVAGRSPHEYSLPSAPPPSPRPAPQRKPVPPSPKHESKPSYEEEGEEAVRESAAPPEAEFREKVDTFLQNIVAEGYRNPDGSVSAIGHPTFETSEFDFGPYARRLYWKVRSNWSPSPIMTYLGKTWEVDIEFDIARDGTVENLKVSKESGIPAYDREALYAILSSYPLEPLPDGYARERVGVRWHFFYHVYQQ